MKAIKTGQIGEVDICKVTGQKLRVLYQQSEVRFYTTLAAALRQLWTHLSRSCSRLQAVYRLPKSSCTSPNFLSQLSGFVNQVTIWTYNF